MELLEWLFGPKSDGTESFREVCLMIFPGTEEGHQGQSEAEMTLSEELGIFE